MAHRYTGADISAINSTMAVANGTGMEKNGEWLAFSVRTLAPGWSF